jgi:hypothetical protein
MDLEIVGSSDQTQMMKPPDVQQLLSLIGLVRLLAEARGADASDKAYELYAVALAEFDPDDVRTVIEIVARRRRAEGEKSFPPLGDLIEPLERRRDRRRQEKQRSAQRQKQIDEFWSWAPEWMELTGNSEEELLKRWPNMQGTKPR